MFNVLSAFWTLLGASGGFPAVLVFIRGFTCFQRFGCFWEPLGAHPGCSFYTCFHAFLCTTVHKGFQGVQQTHAGRPTTPRKDPTDTTKVPPGTPKGAPRAATRDSKARPRGVSGKLGRMLLLSSRSLRCMPVPARRCRSNALPVPTLRQVYWLRPCRRTLIWDR